MISVDISASESISSETSDQNLLRRFLFAASEVPVPREFLFDNFRLQSWQSYNFRFDLNSRIFSCLTAINGAENAFR